MPGATRRHLLLAGACAPLTGCGLLGPDIAFNYRLNITVEIAGQTYAGSGVMHVAYTSTGFMAGFDGVGAYDTVCTADAVVIDLKSHGLLFGMLRGSQWEGGFDARYPADVLSVNTEKVETAGDRLMRMQDAEEEVPIAFSEGWHDYRDRFPLLVRFGDINDPQTAQIVTPKNFAAIYGNGASIVGATVQVTDAPITTGIERAIPWLARLREPEKFEPWLHENFSAHARSDISSLTLENFELRAPKSIFSAWLGL